MTVELQNIIVLVPERDLNDLYAEVGESLGDEREVGRIVNDWYLEAQKPVLSIIDKYRECGAKVLGSSERSRVIVAAMTSDAMKEIEKLPGVQVRPLPKPRVNKDVLQK